MVPHQPLRLLRLADLLVQLAEGLVHRGQDGVATSGQLGLQSGQLDQSGELGVELLEGLEDVSSGRGEDPVDGVDSAPANLEKYFRRINWRENISDLLVSLDDPGALNHSPATPVTKVFVPAGRLWWSNHKIENYCCLSKA